MKISPKNFAQAVYEATEGKSGKDLEAVLERSTQILKDKRMLGRSEEFLNALQNILDKKTNTIRVKVTTAEALSPQAQSKLEHEIKEKHKAKHVIGEFFEKKELLGGVRIEVHDEVFDDTYRNRMNKLEAYLTRPA